MKRNYYSKFILCKIYEDKGMYFIIVYIVYMIENVFLILFIKCVYKFKDL